MVSSTEVPHRGGRWQARARHWGAVTAFVGPFLLLLALFQYLPIVTMLGNSLHDYTMLQPDVRRFVGLQNYLAVFADPQQRQAFLATFLFALGVVIVVVPCAFLIAVYLNGDLPARRLVRTIVFLPVITSGVVVAMMWTFLLDPTNGLINNALSTLGIPKQGFFTSAAEALPSLVVVVAWQQIGFATIFYLSGLQAIPRELEEAAILDGANSLQRLRWIILPLLSRTTLLVVVVVSVFALQAFALPLLMTGGGPEGTTNFVMYDVYETAFTMQQPGLASAISGVFMLCVLLISLVQMWLLRSRWNY